MKKFKDYLIEETKKKKQKKLLHIEHPEDAHFSTANILGFQKAHGALTALHRRLSGHGGLVHISTKYDGSPSIVFGTHPETEKFFVGTKSVFNTKKAPKVNYTHEDIEKNHTSPDLKAKLHTALQYLPVVVPPKGVYQGDIMHTPGDVTDKDGKLSFKPNTITYSTKKDSDLGKKISKSKLGLVVHTKYNGPKFKEMTASADVDHHNFGNHEDVHLISPNHHLDHVLYHPNYRTQVQQALNQAYDLHKSASKKIKDMPHKHIRTYINSCVRRSEHPDVVDFCNHLRKEIKQPKKLAAALKHVDDNENAYQKAFDVHAHMRRAKNLLLNALNTHQGDFEHTIDDAKTKGEGFVVRHTATGMPIKLVSREEFSKQNFFHHKNKHRVKP